MLVDGPRPDARAMHSLRLGIGGWRQKGEADGGRRERADLRDDGGKKEKMERRRGDGTGKVKLRLPQDCLPLGRGSDSPINSMRHFLETFLEGLRAAKQVASLRRWHGSDGQLVGRTELYAANPRIPNFPVFPHISDNLGPIAWEKRANQ